MTRTRVFAFAVVVAASLAGCRSTGEVEYAGEVRVTSPELVAISPGVQVVADADEPLFYSHGSYWLYRDGYWFSSGNYYRGFTRADFALVPQELRRIEAPQAYVHYRSNLGRTRQARTPQMRRRSQQPQQPQQPSPQPAAPTPEQELPSQSPADPYAPHHPPSQSPADPNAPRDPQSPSGTSPTQPTTPPTDLPDQATPPPEADTDYQTNPIDDTTEPDSDPIDE